MAAGAIAKKWLAECHGVRVRGYMSQLGPIPIPFVSWDEVPNNPFYAPNADIVPNWKPIWTSCAATAIRSARASSRGREPARRLGRADL